ncbi:MAG: hypothetical protein HDT29_04260, partial [Clostridiales bacterium]|nr:hypothetical protein [Clostridiales bacterium]
KGNTKDFPLSAGELPCDTGKYIVELSLPTADANNYKIKSGCEEFDFEITKAQIVAKWVNGDNNIPVLSGLDDTTKAIIGYIYYDEEGNQLEDGATLEIGKSYKVKAIFLDDNAKNYEFVTEDGQATPNESAETEQESFTLTAGNSGGSLGGVTGGDGQDPSDPENPAPGSGFDFSKVTEALKQWWQVIASAISIILIVAFMAKGLGYASKKKENKRLIDSKYSAYAVGLFGITMTNWTIIACILMGVAVLAFIFMLLEKSGYKKSLRALDDAKEEYARNKEENMYMRMMGGQPNMNGGMGMGAQGFAYAQPMVGLGADDIRGIVADTMNNMLPNVTQYLPQEASYNDELVQQLIKQNAQNEERIRQLTEENEEKIRELTEQNQEIIRNLANGQEMLMQRLSEQSKESVDESVIEKLVVKLSKQQDDEKSVEKEVAATNANDEKIEMLMRNQEMLMKQIMDLSSKVNTEKQVVVPFMQQPIIAQPSEKVVERIIEKPVEKIIEKEVKVEVPVEVEKVVEKVVEKEVPVEVEKVVEKVVEKEVVKEVPVPMPVEKPAPKAKAPAKRLTLDEAYAKLSATQKKIFDTLKAYALTKDKCKEKKSTYFIVLGQSTVNPLVKLTIKKNTTVALFKMEDEYFKDIRRGATSDGTKVKVKESEVVVGDMQALSTAKEMIDLREDQIERYNDYLKEQKSMRKK